MNAMLDILNWSMIFLIVISPFREAFIFKNRRRYVMNGVCRPLSKLILPRTIHTPSHGGSNSQVFSPHYFVVTSFLEK